MKQSALLNECTSQVVMSDESTKHWMLISRFLLLFGLCLSLLFIPFSAQAEEDEVSLKRKVAIARFSNETKTQPSFFVDESGDRLGKQASDILSARLAQTEKFLLYERQDADEVSTEKVLSGLSSEGIAVDYLIIGSVSEFGRSTESKSGVFSRAKMQKAYAKVNVRLIEVATGRILQGFEGAGEAVSESKRTLGVGSSAGFDQSLTDKSISQAISKLVSNLVERMTDSPWRSFLLDEDQGTYIMAGGESQGVKPGMEVSVFKKGKQVKNPQTGGVIELPGTKVARLKVESTFGEDEISEVAFMKLVSGQIGETLNEYYVLAD